MRSITLQVTTIQNKKAGNVAKNGAAYIVYGDTIYPSDSTSITEIKLKEIANEIASKPDFDAATTHEINVYILNKSQEKKSYKVSDARDFIKPRADKPRYFNATFEEKKFEISIETAADAPSTNEAAAAPASTTPHSDSTASDATAGEPAASAAVTPPRELSADTPPTNGAAAVAPANEPTATNGGETLAVAAPADNQRKVSFADETHTQEFTTDGANDTETASAASEAHPAGADVAPDNTATDLSDAAQLEASLAQANDLTAAVDAILADADTGNAHSTVTAGAEVAAGNAIVASLLDDETHTTAHAASSAAATEQPKPDALTAEDTEDESDFEDSLEAQPAATNAEPQGLANDATTTAIAEPAAADVIPALEAVADEPQRPAGAATTTTAELEPAATSAATTESHLHVMSPGEASRKIRILTELGVDLQKTSGNQAKDTESAPAAAHAATTTADQLKSTSAVRRSRNNKKRSDKAAVTTPKNDTEASSALSSAELAKLDSLLNRPNTTETHSATPGAAADTSIGSESRPVSAAAASKRKKRREKGADANKAAAAAPASGAPKKTQTKASFASFTDPEDAAAPVAGSTTDSAVYGLGATMNDQQMKGAVAVDATGSVNSDLQIPESIYTTQQNLAKETLKTIAITAIFSHQHMSAENVKKAYNLQRAIWALSLYTKEDYILYITNSTSPDDSEALFSHDNLTDDQLGDIKPTITALEMVKLPENVIRNPSTNTDGEQAITYLKTLLSVETLATEAGLNLGKILTKSKRAAVDALKDMLENNTSIKDNPEELLKIYTALQLALMGTENPEDADPDLALIVQEQGKLRGTTGKTKTYQKMSEMLAVRIAELMIKEFNNPDYRGNFELTRKLTETAVFTKYHHRSGEPFWRAAATNALRAGIKAMPEANRPAARVAFLGAAVAAADAAVAAADAAAEVDTTEVAANPHPLIITGVAAIRLLAGILSDATTSDTDSSGLPETPLSTEDLSANKKQAITALTWVLTNDTLKNNSNELLEIYEAVQNALKFKGDTAGDIQAPALAIVTQEQGKVRSTIGKTTTYQKMSDMLAVQIAKNEFARYEAFLKYTDAAKAFEEAEADFCFIRSYYVPKVNADTAATAAATVDNALTVAKNVVTITDIDETDGVTDGHDDSDDSDGDVESATIVADFTASDAERTATIAASASADYNQAIKAKDEADEAVDSALQALIDANATAGITAPVDLEGAKIAGASFQEIPAYKQSGVQGTYHYRRGSLFWNSAATNVLKAKIATLDKSDRKEARNALLGRNAVVADSTTNSDTTEIDGKITAKFAAYTSANEVISGLNEGLADANGDENPEDVPTLPERKRVAIVAVRAALTNGTLKKNTVELLEIYVALQDALNAKVSRLNGDAADGADSDDNASADGADSDDNAASKGNAATPNDITLAKVTEEQGRLRRKKGKTSTYQQISDMIAEQVVKNEFARFVLFLNLSEAIKESKVAADYTGACEGVSDTSLHRDDADAKAAKVTEAAAALDAADVDAGIPLDAAAAKVTEAAAALDTAAAAAAALDTAAAEDETIAYIPADDAEADRDIMAAALAPDNTANPQTEVGASYQKNAAYEKSGVQSNYHWRSGSAFWNSAATKVLNAEISKLEDKGQQAQARSMLLGK